jgi:LacI family transcriptional regulator
MADKSRARVTVKDIAKVVGVSATAVSMALNNNGSLTQAMRDEIKRVAKELGYVPNTGARFLRGTSTRSFGVVINYFNNPFFHDFFIGLEDAINPRDFSYWATQSWDNLLTEQQQVRKLTQMGVDGLIVLPCSKETEHLDEVYQQLNIPLVLISHSIGDRFPAVVADNHAGAKLATQHLFDELKRPVIHIAGPIGAKSGVEQRYNGFCETMAMLDQQFSAENSVFFAKELRAKAGYDVMCEIMQRVPLPVSIFVVNDETALGVFDYCMTHNLRMPEDVALVGFSNIDLLDTLKIPLSTINIPKREMGQCAAELLFAQLDKKKSPLSAADKVRVLPVSLIKRGSSHS